MLTTLGLIGLLLLTPNAFATTQVVQYFTHAPVSVCQPSDTNTNCGGVGSSQWTLSASNLYSPLNDMVTIGETSSVSHGDLTVNGVPNSIVYNNAIPSGQGGIDANTQLMLHLNNNITDSAQNNYTITNTGSVTFANTSPAFAGTFYGVFNTGQALSHSGGICSNINGTSNFTVDLQINPTSITGTNEGLFVCETSIINSAILYLNSDGSVQFLEQESGIVQINFTTPPAVVTTGSWQHIMLVRNGNNFSIYVGGVSKISATSSHSIASFTTWLIGFFSGSTNPIVGNVEEYRVSSIARETSNFTPPSLPYDSGNAVATPEYIYGDNGSILAYTQADSSTNNWYLYNNGIQSLHFDSVGNPYFPVLTTNGILSTSGGTGLINIVVTTGTGNVVLSTSPTIVTPNITGNTTSTGVWKKRGTTYSTATSITPNSDTDDISYMANTQGAGTFTVNNDTGTHQVNGQSWILKISSTSVQTFSWGTIYNGGTNGLPTATLGTSIIQYYAFLWDSVNNHWDYTGNVGGFN